MDGRGTLGDDGRALGEPGTDNLTPGTPEGRGTGIEGRPLRRAGSMESASLGGTVTCGGEVTGMVAAPATAGTLDDRSGSAGSETASSTSISTDDRPAVSLGVSASSSAARSVTEATRLRGTSSTGTRSALLFFRVTDASRSLRPRRPPSRVLPQSSPDRRAQRKRSRLIRDGTPRVPHRERSGDRPRRSDVRPGRGHDW